MEIELKGYKKTKKRIKKLIKLVKELGMNMEDTIFIIEGYGDQSQDLESFKDKIKMFK